MGIRFVDRIN